MTVTKGVKKRPILALDLAEPWKEAFQQKVLQEYPDESSIASLARRLLQDVVICFSTEKELRERGLLAPYRSMGKPDALLFAIRRYEQLRKQGEGDGANQPKHKGSK